MSLISADNLQVFLILVFPGFLSLRIYGLFIKTRKPDTTSQIVDAVAFSVVNLAVYVGGSFALELIGLNGRIGVQLLFVFCLLVSPVLLGYCAFQLHTSRALAKLGLIHPTPGSWDYFFGQRKPCMALFHLKSGRMVGGFYGYDSFASSFPHDEDVFIEKVCTVDQSSGQYTGFIQNSGGILIKRSDCEVIEFHTLGDAE
jgi:hypothetical protein